MDSGPDTVVRARLPRTLPCSGVQSDELSRHSHSSRGEKCIAQLDCISQSAVVRQQQATTHDILSPPAVSANIVCCCAPSTRFRRPPDVTTDPVSAFSLCFHILLAVRPSTYTSALLLDVFRVPLPPLAHTRVASDSFSLVRLTSWTDPRFGAPPIDDSSSLRLLSAPRPLLKDDISFSSTGGRTILGTHQRQFRRRPIFLATPFSGPSCTIALGAKRRPARALSSAISRDGDISPPTALQFTSAPHKAPRATKYLRPRPHQLLTANSGH